MHSCAGSRRAREPPAATCRKGTAVHFVEPALSKRVAFSVEQEVPCQPDRQPHPNGGRMLGAIGARDGRCRERSMFASARWRDEATGSARRCGRCGSGVATTGGPSTAVGEDPAAWHFASCRRQRSGCPRGAQRFYRHAAATGLGAGPQLGDRVPLGVCSGRSNRSFGKGASPALARHPGGAFDPAYRRCVTRRARSQSSFLLSASRSGRDLSRVSHIPEATLLASRFSSRRLVPNGSNS